MNVQIIFLDVLDLEVVKKRVKVKSVISSATNVKSL